MDVPKSNKQPDDTQSSEEEEMQEVSKSNEDDSFVFDPVQKQRNFAMLTNNEGNF